MNQQLAGLLTSLVKSTNEPCVFARACVFRGAAVPCEFCRACANQRAWFVREHSDGHFDLQDLDGWYSDGHFDLLYSDGRFDLLYSDGRFDLQVLDGRSDPLYFDGQYSDGRFDQCHVHSLNLTRTPIEADLGL